MQTAKQRRQSNRLISNVDTIGLASAMLAVLFVLMLPFMIIGPNTGGRSRDVNLAKVHHPVPMRGANREDAIIISITKDGKFYFGRDGVELSQIAIKIQDAVRNGSPKIVYLNADARARYRFVKDVLDIMHSSRLEKIVFLVEQRKTEQQQ